MGLCTAHPCNPCRAGFRMLNRSEEPHVSSSLAAARYLGWKWCFGFSGPTVQDGSPVLTHLLHLAFLLLSLFLVATQDEVEFYSLNLRKPNALRVLVCQNRVPILVYLQEVVSTGLRRKDLPNILGTEMEVHGLQNSSGRFSCPISCVQ